MSLTSIMVRKLFKSSDEKRDAGLTTPAGIDRFDDITYGRDPAWQSLDVYRPKDRQGEELPVIVSVHGGGWVYGDKELYQYYCMSLAERGFAVVNFTYRLAPDFRFPAQIEDVNLVFAWILASAEKYGLDTENIFAVGDSAGAHLISLYCCMMDSEFLQKRFGQKTPDGLIIRALGLNCGVYEVRKSEKGMMKNLMKDLLGRKGTEDDFRMLCPIHHVSATFPPSFVMTATGDFVKDQAMPMVRKLESVGVEVEYHCYGDEENKLGHVFHCNMKSEDAARCNDDECNYFRSKMQ